MVTKCESYRERLRSRVGRTYRHQVAPPPVPADGSGQRQAVLADADQAQPFAEAIA